MFLLNPYDNHRSWLQVHNLYLFLKFIYFERETDRERERERERDRESKVGSMLTAAGLNAGLELTKH